MNALGVLTIMSLLAPGPNPAMPLTIREDVDAGNTTTTATPPPTAAAAASASADVSEISPSVSPDLIRVTEPSAEHSEEKYPLTFTASPELGPIREETDQAGRHSTLQHGPSPLASAENESDEVDIDVYSSPGSLTAMAGASALRSRRPLLSPVRTAGLSAYASVPVKFEGESEHAEEDVHSQDIHNHDVHGQDLHNYDVHGQDLHNHDIHSQNLHNHNVHVHEVHEHDVHGQDVRGHDVRVHDVRGHEVYGHELHGHNIRGHNVHSQDDTVVTALRGHYTLHSDPPYNQHISLIAHHLGHVGGSTSSGTSSTGASADSGTDTDEHQTFPTISSLGEHHVYPTIGAFPYESAKPTGPHIETVAIAHKPAHKPKELHHKKGWSKHWKTALRMLAGLAPLALLLAALPPNVLIVNPTQYVNRTSPMHMRGRIVDADDGTLTDISSCRRVCEQVRATLSTVRIGGHESLPGFGDLLEAARSPTCAESLCAPDPPTSTTTTTTTTVTTRTATPTTHPTPAEVDGELEHKNQLVKKYAKVMKRRKIQQHQTVQV